MMQWRDLVFFREEDMMQWRGPCHVEIKENDDWVVFFRGRQGNPAIE
jgi:hypothetical protein